MPFVTPAGLSAQERRAIDEEIARLRAQLDEDEIGAVGGVNRIDHTNMLVVATIFLAVLAVVAIIIIFLVRPDKDNTALVATLMGFLVPLMTALLAAAVQQVHAAVNSRLTQLLRVTAAKSRAEGILAQKLAETTPHDDAVATASLAVPPADPEPRS